MLRCGSVFLGGIVKNKRAYSIGRVVDASSVEQKRRYTNRRIVVCGVEVKRSSTNSSIETSAGSAKERIPTKCCICSASRKVLKRFAPFGCGGIGIAPVRRRIDCLHLR